jgi:hypothetical protein
MDQQYGNFHLVNPARVFDGNEHVSMFSAVRITRMVESQCRPFTVSADLAVDRFSRIHMLIIAVHRSRSETHTHGASWD